MDFMAGMSLFSPITQTVNALIEVRDFAKLAEVRIDLLNKIGSAQAAYIELQAKHQALLNEDHAKSEAIRDLKEKIRDKKHYELVEVIPGAFAYSAKPLGEGGGPAHYLCQRCRDKGIKSVLRVKLRANGTTYYTCRECKDWFQTGPADGDAPSIVHSLA